MTRRKRGRPNRRGLRQENPEQLRLIADNVPAMSIAYDEHLRCLFANRRFAEFFGLTTTTIVGKHLRDIIGERAFEEVKPYFDEVLAGRPSRYKRTRIMGNGEARHLEVELIPHTASDGENRGLFAITTDVTERRRQEQLRLLGYSAAALIADADSVNAAIQAVIHAICDSEGWECGRFFHIAEGDGSLRMLDGWGIPEPTIQKFLRHSRHIEYKPGEGLVGYVWSTGKPLSIPDLNQDPRALLKAHPERSDIRGAFLFPVQFQGRVTAVLVFNSRRVRCADQPLLQLIQAIGSQIGQFLERKRAEQNLRSSEARLRAVIESANDGIIIYDQALNIVSVNGEAERLIGVPAAALLGKPGFMSAVPCMYEDGSPVDLADRPSAIAMRTGKPVTGRVIGVRHGARSVTWLSISIGLLYGADNGAPTGAVSILRDISSSKRDEQLLKLEQRVARAFTDAADVTVALEGAIRAICENERWDCGRYLKVEQGVLRFYAGWAVPKSQAQRFIEVSREMVYAPGVGLAGTTLLSKQPLWVEDMWSDGRVARGALVREVGLRGAFTFPVIVQGAVIGAFIFQSHEIREPDSRLLHAIELIGDQIDQIIRRADAEASMRQSEARFRSLCSLASDIFWEQDSEYRFTSISSPSGRTNPDKVIGRTAWELGAVNVSEDDWVAHKANLDARGRFYDLEVCYRQSDGLERWYSVTGEPFFGASGEFLGYRGVGRDISARKHDERRVRHLASHDILTGLPNRTSFGELLDAAMRNARRRGLSIAVMFIDLDRFKVINDTFGHAAGDALLKEVAARLSGTLRASDIVARLGGDEFVALLQDVKELPDIEIVARKVLSALEYPVSIHNQECTVTASVGVAVFPQDGEDAEALMRKADTAMYQAKDAGRNSYKLYEPELDLSKPDRLGMETALRRALERNEFRLHYQPRVNAHTGKVTSVEALLRWVHPEKGEILPGSFIPLAEETGIISALGLWALREACAQSASWRDEGLGAVRVAVNVSARQLADEHFEESIQDALAAARLDPSLLEVELTESMLARSPERAAALLGRLRKMGVRLALDDFGTGYSSLAQIKRYPLDTLKIDRSFVAGLPHDRADAGIAHAIIAMGKTFGLGIVAEGVETGEQLLFLEAHGCEEIQGFLISRPLTASRCGEYLRAAMSASSPMLAETR